MNRLLLKLSGEALAGTRGFGIDQQVVADIAAEVAPVAARGVQLSIVLGGGNLFRGITLEQQGLLRTTGDHMGMMATIMNGLAVRDVFRARSIDAVVLSAIEVQGVVPRYSVILAEELLSLGKVLILVAGTGNPFFTTDTAACLRGIELQADAVLKATKVDGVYSADPLTDPNAERFEVISFDEVINRNLKVMDLTAFALCREHSMPLYVFDIQARGALDQIARGGKVGTRIDHGERA